MDIITKDFPVTAGEPTDEHPNGSFEVILSAPTLDRDGEVVDAKAFEPLPDHITFDTDHSMTCDSVVGSGVPYYDAAGQLRVKGGFCSDERSQMIRQKVLDGHIRTTSVTFMAPDRRKDEKGVPHVVKAELLNGTFTPVPANREAVVMSAKSILAKEGRRNSATDMDHIQAAHDAMSALGALCGGKSVLRVKSIIGSVEALRDRVADALEDTYDRWTCIRGVIPADGGGTVVFDSYDDDCDVTSYSQTYTDDGSVVTLTGQATEVDVMEIVTPDADADRESDDVLKSATDAAGAAAKAAAPAVKAADEDEAVVDAKGRMTANENAARFAFGG